MSPESLLAEKLAAYRGAFDKACRGLFGGGEGVTLEYEQDDDDDAVDVAATPASAPSSEPSFENSNRGSKSAKELRAAVHSIAEDFAHEFNAKLALAAKNDASVELVASRYEMTSAHVDELDRLLAAPLGPLLAKLAAGDLDGARRATLDAWPQLEKRIKSKWQAYFILTFQDVSVERKAARDRHRLQPRFDESSMAAMVQAEAARRSMPDLVGGDEAQGGMSPWIAVLALLVLAAAGGWLLMRGHAQHAAAAVTKSAH